MRKFTVFAAGFVAISLGGCVTSLERANSPDAVGISSARLKDISATIQAGIDKKEIPGAVVLIARHGQIAYFEAFGRRDPETGSPMTRDAIFRIASMTKPVTSIAAMMLVEQGKLNLSDPVSRYLPEFKNVKVGVEAKDASGKIALSLETPKHEMTVLDLMRHTSGLTYAFTGKSLVRNEYTKAKIGDAGATNTQFVSRLASLPLQNQPGMVWDYSHSTDVLGRIVEVLSGQELGQYFSERIFEPLGMKDTGFWTSDPDRQNRIAQAMDAATGKRVALPDRTRKGWESGGGGLLSTAADYARFCQMLLNGGELDGRRIVSAKSIESMTTDHLPKGIVIHPLADPAADVRPAMGNGFGLGFMVRVADGKSPLPGSVGDFSWPGIFGTYFWVDPKKDMFAIMMIQVPAAAGPIRAKYRNAIRNGVYSAVVN